VSNTPFRGYKTQNHEGGIATPFIVRWPAVIETPGAMANQVGHVIDLMPTCLDVAGVQSPGSFDGHKILPLEGKSLLSVLEGRRRESRNALFWEIGGNPAMRMGKWKLVARRGKPWELYDIEADRTEMKDLAAQEPARVREMAAMYKAWASRVGAAPGPIAP